MYVPRAEYTVRAWCAHALRPAAVVCANTTYAGRAQTGMASIHEQLGVRCVSVTSCRTADVNYTGHATFHAHRSCAEDAWGTALRSFGVRATTPHSSGGEATALTAQTPHYAGADNTPVGVPAPLSSAKLTGWGELALSIPDGDPAPPVFSRRGRSRGVATLAGHVRSFVRAGLAFTPPTGHDPHRGSESTIYRLTLRGSNQTDLSRVGAEPR